MLPPRAAFRDEHTYGRIRGSRSLEGFGDARCEHRRCCQLYVEIFGEKDAAGARWIAGDFTKYAPAETLIEPRCLEADRVKNTRPAATPTRFYKRLGWRVFGEIPCDP